MRKIIAVEKNPTDRQVRTILNELCPNWTYMNGGAGITTYYNENGDVIASAIFDNKKCIVKRITIFYTNQEQNK